MTVACVAGGVVLAAIVFAAWHWIAAGRAMRRNERLQKKGK